MGWHCALLQRWLPEYPDGDLPAFWKRRLQSHLERCSECRRELAALQEVVAAIKAAPVAEPEPEFWTEFSRELHLKLARAAHDIKDAPPAASRLWWSRLPYLLGAPALAVLALVMITYFSSPEAPILAPKPQMAEESAPTPAMKASRVAEAPKSLEAPKVAAVPQAEGTRTPAVAEAPLGAASDQFSLATLDNNGTSPEDDPDIFSGDLDSVLAGMNDQEKENFLKKMSQKKEDGSCLESSLSISLA